MMTTFNEEVRQASLFTMNGLIDPRLVVAVKPGDAAKARSLRTGRAGKVSLAWLFNLVTSSAR